MTRDPAGFRLQVRRASFRGPTAGVAPGFAQANLVVIPADWADEFREFCRVNPRPCPLLDETAAGSGRPLRLAPSADVRTDVPGYRIYREGTFLRAFDLVDGWRADLVAFLIGCSFSFERAFLREGIPVRHIEMGTNVPMYVTSMPTTRVGRLGGPLVASMRPIPRSMVDRAREISAGFTGAHGEPIHVGDASALGIADLARPDYGDPVPVRQGELPVFWACGVTPQLVLARSGCPWFATHEPGHMFVSDREETIGPM